MPELPEVETVRQGLRPTLEGAEIISAKTFRENLRYPFPPHLSHDLEKQTICSISRRAKYLLFSLSNDLTLVSHLGMSGSWRIENTIQNQDYYEKGKKPKHDHFEMNVKAKDGKLYRALYNDPRRFGFLKIFQTDKVFEEDFLRTLGPEPTGNALSGDYLQKCFAKKQAPLKAALLDQKNIAGLGNIYVCEALWRAKLSPKTKALTVANNKTKANELATHIRDVINEAIKAGGSSLKDYVHTDGSLGYFQHQFAVYDREGKNCSCCGTPIERIVQSGRSTFYCPRCQKG